MKYRIVQVKNPFTMDKFYIEKEYKFLFWKGWSRLTDFYYGDNGYVVFYNLKEAEEYISKLKQGIQTIIIEDH
jgi:hypothetical protein